MICYFSYLSFISKGFCHAVGFSNQLNTILFRLFYSLYSLMHDFKLRYAGCLKKIPPLGKQRNKTIEYRDFLSSQAYSLIFNLNASTLHFKIVLRTPEIRVYKVEFWSAPETRAFVKGPSHYLISKHIAKKFNFDLQLFLLKRMIF